MCSPVYSPSRAGARLDGGAHGQGRGCYSGRATDPIYAPEGSFLSVSVIDANPVPASMRNKTVSVSTRGFVFLQCLDATWTHTHVQLLYGICGIAGARTHFRALGISECTTSCLCFYGWGGNDCSEMSCSLNCSFPNGFCSNGTCVCDAIMGYYGRNCSEQFGIVQLPTDGSALTPSFAFLRAARSLRYVELVLWTRTLCAVNLDRA